MPLPDGYFQFIAQELNQSSNIDLKAEDIQRLLISNGYLIISSNSFAITSTFEEATSLCRERSHWIISARQLLPFELQNC